MHTKNIESVKVSDEVAMSIVTKLKEAEINRQISFLNPYLATIVSEFSRTNSRNKGWIKIKNKDLFYNSIITALVPNIATFECGCCTSKLAFTPSSFKKEFCGYVGSLMSENEVKCAFEDKEQFLKDTFDITVPPSLTVRDGEIERYLNVELNYEVYSFNSQDNMTYHVPIYRISDQPTTSTAADVLALVKQGLIPEDLLPETEQKYRLVVALYASRPTAFEINEDNKLVCNDLIVSNLAKNEKINTINGERLTTIKSFLDEYATNSEMKLSNEEIAPTIEKLLNCDTIRCDIDSYDQKVLIDPNRGHWDLWEGIQSEHNVEMMLDTPLIGRNPVADVRFDGVIGIDFGTKSTVVVYQENSDHTMLMRIGTGKLSKEVQANHYENPTVLEFIDFESFMKLYKAKPGRPETLWSHITTSHTAFNSFLNSNSEQYYSHLNELKQWAGDKNRKLRLRDKQNKDIILPSYLEINEGDFDPIELYAYYIGLYINNMHNGIYMDYLLSYPIAYEKRIRDKMIESFTRGIKKSLPTTILNNENIMSKFKVKIGASEPVAYAICALEEYGFDPCDEDKVFYGVFDFGGGTTDFDFGVYYEAPSRRHDYVIESFGAGGDKYLGGENILELLAFEVFKANQLILREKNMTFVLPPECKKFTGSETLLSESQEAKLNMAQLMERLRPFWEKAEGYEKELDTGKLKLNLFDVEGGQELNVELDVSIDDLERILYERIEQGVRNFFMGTIEAFNLPKNTNIVKQINIFLAGNSSKSSTLREIFANYIKEYSTKIFEKMPHEKEEDYFKIFPPLGTTEAIEMQKELGIERQESSVESPTGKTGVAFGLVKSRYGGRIKLINETGVDEEIKFSFYIGYEKKQKFRVNTNRDIEYGKWYFLIDASEEDFTIYYSNLPEASNGQLSIKNVLRKKCRLLTTYPDANIYYRAVTPNTIECVVSNDEDILEDKYLGGMFKLELKI